MMKKFLKTNAVLMYRFNPFGEMLMVASVIKFGWLGVLLSLGAIVILNLLFYFRHHPFEV